MAPPRRHAHTPHALASPLPDPGRCWPARWPAVGRHLDPRPWPTGRITSVHVFTSVPVFFTSVHVFAEIAPPLRRKAGPRRTRASSAEQGAQAFPVGGIEQLNAEIAPQASIADAPALRPEAGCEPR